MGSPYATCKVSLSGEWVPDLPDGGEDFQDLKAWSPDGQQLALVRWNVSRANEPGFNVFVISVPERRVYRSRRFRGCCRSLAWEDGRFVYTALAQVRGGFRPGA